jgi:hypothetical protein
VLLILLFIFDCPQPCGPPNNAFIGAAAAPGIPALAGVGATPVAGGAGTVQPFFDIDWSYCCMRVCLVFLSRTCIQTVRTRHNAGAPLAPMFAAIVAREPEASAAQRSQPTTRARPRCLAPFRRSRCRRHRCARVEAKPGV